MKTRGIVFALEWILANALVLREKTKQKMKTRAIVFALEWILANALVLRVLDDKYSFHTLPWVFWNVTFGIFLFKLFTSPEDDGKVWPVGPSVGAFGFVLTAVKVDDAYNDDGVPWNVWLGCCVCLFGFALVGVSSDSLGDAWRDTPPPCGERQRKNIIIDGPYKIIRHPIYCGLLSESLGSVVVGGFKSWIAVMALFAVTTAYVVQLTQEEQELNRLSDGRYEEQYKRGTKYRLVPFLF